MNTYYFSQGNTTKEYKALNDSHALRLAPIPSYVFRKGTKECIGVKIKVKET